MLNIGTKGDALLRISTQFENGSPVYPTGHVQIGRWFVTAHCAYSPHAPGQGSPHLSLMHARLAGHSELIVHSGRQLGDRPT